MKFLIFSSNISPISYLFQFQESRNFFNSNQFNLYRDLMLRVGISGFGRIGRMFLRAAIAQGALGRDF
ncbi:hypothetical protein KAW38_00005, partial [Candidatus Micrarchaeota archaeon]|nr:hypothetical protein [Candidatus Micrarchaeota archaeon]